MSAADPRSLPYGEVQIPGTASASSGTGQVKAAAREALVRHAAVLRPSLSKPRPADVGFRLGRSRGTACWSSVRDSTVVLGRPGAGKGLHLVVPMAGTSARCAGTTRTTGCSRERSHEPLVTDGLFAAVRAVATAGRWRTVQPMARPSCKPSALRGLVTCGACDRRMVSSFNHAHYRFHYRSFTR
jgi:hypothetical protein